MNKEEALLLFNGENLESIESEFEDRFFELKQLLIQKPPIRKVWNAKMKQFKRLIQALKVLSEREVEINTENGPQLELPVFTSNVQNTFNSYQQFRSRILQLSSVTSSPAKFIILVDQYLDTTDQYLRQWKNPSEKGEIVISKEPDPMDMINAIRDFNGRGYDEFEEINELPDDHLLVLESKRLTLLFKMNQDAR